MPNLHPLVKHDPTVPSPEYVNVTPHDSNNLNYKARMVMCAVAGDISFVNDGTTVVLAVPANTPIAMMFDRINSTGTDATGIIAWF